MQKAKGDTSGDLLYDKDIRWPLFEFLEMHYGEVRILEEVVIGKSRADALMISTAEGLLYGIEIKSDADTYARLDRQVQDYDRYFDRNYVVVGTKHAYHIEEHVPAHWGIITVELVDGEQDFYILRQPQSNPKTSWEQKIELLWRPELVRLQEWHDMPRYKEKSKKFVADKIVGRIGETIPEDAIQKQLCRLLYERDYETIAETIHEFRVAQKKRRRRKGYRRRRR